MVGFTQKISELKPLFTSKVRFVVFGETLKTKSGLRFAHVAGHKYCEGSYSSRPWLLLELPRLGWVSGI